MMEWIVLPSLLLLILSWLFKSIRIFTLGFFLVLSPVYSEEEKVQYTPELIRKMEDLQAGNLSPRQKAKLADDLYKAGAKDEALALFEENLPKDHSDSELPPEAYLNYGTALLEKGRIQEGLTVYDDLNERMENSPESASIKEKMEKNTVSVFQQQKEKKKEQDKKDKENKENKDQDQQGQGGQGQSQDKKQQGKSGEDKNKDPKEDGKDKQDKKDKGDKGEEKKEDEGDEEKKDEPKDGQEKDGEKKPLPPKKLAPKLKQLMSDDRQLQMKMIEQGTRELNRKKLRNSKDW
jgi:hypothetical protein